MAFFAWRIFKSVLNVTHCPLSNPSHSRTFVKNALVDNKLRIFGNKVKTLREEKGMSQEALAFKAGFDRTYISLVERGKRNLSLLNICRFAEALDVKPSELLNDF